MAPLWLPWFQVFKSAFPGSLQFKEVADAPSISPASRHPVGPSGTRLLPVPAQRVRTVDHVRTDRRACHRPDGSRGPRCRDHRHQHRNQRPPLHGQQRHRKLPGGQAHRRSLRGPGGTARLQDPRGRGSLEHRPGGAPRLPAESRRDRRAGDRHGTDHGAGHGHGGHQHHAG